ncbi:MAG: family 16 glycosylhydrolase [Cellvibrio sp.]
MPKYLFVLLAALGLTACGGSGSSGTPAANTSTSVSSIPLSSSMQSSSTSSASSPMIAGEFRLLFRDDFDYLDTSRWQLMHHSWDTNIALFSDKTVKVDDGYMTLTLLAAPEGTVSDGGAKQFLGAEVRSIETIKYGRVSARAKLAKGSAVVSALVSIYTPWPADNWNEFDIESLGHNPRQIQFNAMVYDGVSPPPSGQSVTPTQFPALKELPFDTSEDFHTYTIEWTPTEATFAIDGTIYHRWNSKIDLMGLPQNILLTIWASNIEDWAGPVDETTFNARAVYDWIEVWEYQE